MKFRRTDKVGKFEVKIVKIREQWAKMSFVSRSLHAPLKFCWTVKCVVGWSCKVTKEQFLVTFLVLFFSFRSLPDNSLICVKFGNWIIMKTVPCSWYSSVHVRVPCLFFACSYEAPWSARKAWPDENSWQELVCTAVMCDNWWWTVRGLDLDII